MMNNGIIVGPESEQKPTKNFNLKINHTDENGKILHIVESAKGDLTMQENNFLNIKNINGYIYAERTNIDSIAFVLFATNIDDERRIGLCYEYQPAIDKSIIKAFTSSIYDPTVDDLKNIVIQQVEKQAGFSVASLEIEYLGKCLVSSKMNEHCHLFGVAVDKTLQFKKEGLSSRKNESGHFWATVEEIKDIEDWKGQIIVYKRYLNKKNKILIKKKEQ